MLTPQQLRKIREAQTSITDPTLKNRFVLIYRLPEKLQNVIFSEDLDKKNTNIAIKCKLTSWQDQSLYTLVNLTIVGEISINNFTQNIEDKLLIDIDDAKDIAQQITKEIFLPIKNLLLEAHGPAFITELNKLAGIETFVPTTPKNMPPTQPNVPTAPPRIIPPSIRSIPPSPSPNTSNPPFSLPINNQPPANPDNTKPPIRQFAVPKIDGNIVNLKDLE